MCGAGMSCWDITAFLLGNWGKKFFCVLGDKTGKLGLVKTDHSWTSPNRQHGAISRHLSRRVTPTEIYFGKHGNWVGEVSEDRLHRHGSQQQGPSTVEEEEKPNWTVSSEKGWDSQHCK